MFGEVMDKSIVYWGFFWLTVHVHQVW